MNAPSEIVIVTNGAGRRVHGSLPRLVGRLLCMQCGQIRDEDDQDGAICNDCDRANQEDYDETNT